MKRIIALLMALLLVIGCLAACNSSNDQGNNNSSSKEESAAASSAASSEAASSAASATEAKTGEQPRSIYGGRSDAMWSSSTELSASGDSSKLVPVISIFDDDYTIGQFTLKTMTDKGWGGVMIPKAGKM